MLGVPSSMLGFVWGQATSNKYAITVGVLTAMPVIKGVRRIVLVPMPRAAGF